jgi:hypothetical protein
MMNYRYVGARALCAFVNVCASVQVLWREPESASVAASRWGFG